MLSIMPRARGTTLAIATVLKNLPGFVFGLGILNFVISLFRLVIFLPDMLEIPSYPGRAESAVNLNVSLQALEQRGT